MIPVSIHRKLDDFLEDDCEFQGSRVRLAKVVASAAKALRRSCAKFFLCGATGILAATFERRIER
jgi:hypothetical protein